MYISLFLFVNEYSNFLNLLNRSYPHEQPLIQICNYARIIFIAQYFSKAKQPLFDGI